MKYKLAEHRGTLEEMQKTEKEITEKQYKKIKKNYRFYWFDDRINAFRYIRKNGWKNPNQPMWLNIYE